MNSSLIKKWLPLLVAVIVWLLPVPDGLSSDAWSYFALFLGVVVALVLEPVPAAAVGLIGIVIAVVFRLVAVEPGVDVTAKAAINWGLSGFKNSTVWLIFVAFMFALGYQKSGLGRRIALFLIKKLGRRSLGLGYAVALADLVLAPFIPSNTARSGGTIFPIVNNVPAIYGSTPEQEPEKIGRYLCWTGFAATCVTSSMFLTALAPNLLAISIVEKLLGTEIGWMVWFTGFLPVGIILFLLVPLISYLICPPTIKLSESIPDWAGKELAALGPLSGAEKKMALLALLALLLWIFGGSLMNSTTVGLLVLCLMMLSGVVSWDDIIGNKQAWNVLIWFATLVTLAGGLGQTGFLAWFSGEAGVLLKGYAPDLVMMLMVILFFVLHYFFASITAHVTALLPVFIQLSIAVPGLSEMKLSLLLCFTLGLMGVITPYAAGPGPIWYGSGFIPAGTFWKLGFIMAVVFLATLVLIGFPWVNAMVQ